MRFDRLATLALFHPAVRLLKGDGEGARAILMYHSVSDASEAGVLPYFRLNTSPWQFALQMDVLREGDWDVIPLADLLTPKGLWSQPQRRVAITFDDGYEDFLTNAFPVLEEHGFPASVFLPTGHIAERAREFKGKRCLTWSQVRRLSTGGVHFGSHTVTHRQLYSLSDAERNEELRRSKAQIEDHLGIAVEGFSYPFAFPQHDATFCARFRSILENCGYAYGVCTALGRVRDGDDHFFARRLPVNTLDDAKLLRAKLEGGYDWLGGIQYMAKAFRWAVP